MSDREDSLLESLQDSQPVVNDPLREIVDNKTSSVYTVEEEIPFEIREFLDANGIMEYSFRTILKRMLDGITDVGRAPYIESWSDNHIPRLDYIAREYGPGNYALLFQWRAKDPETQRAKHISRAMPLVIDEHYQDLYEEAQLKKAIIRAERQKRMVQTAKVKNELGANLMGTPPATQNESKLEVGKQYLNEIVEVGEKLGLTRKGVDWEKILATMLPLLPPIIGLLRGNQDSSSKMEDFYKVIIAQQERHNQQMLEMMKVQHGPSTGNDMMKELRDMIFSAIDIKEAISGKKESLADRIFDMIQGVAPQVLDLAMKSQSAREQDFRFQIARQYMNHSPDIKALKEDPQALTEMVQKLDTFFGWEQTDIILQVAQIERPVECPRNPSQRYPANDPRNARSGPEPVSDAVTENNG